ncbi:uncharacterized protein F5Z01DRAFT_670894 [Emericellopsis atlantica]|uniref:Uncharacterized protein n=1 Tax=Emericellopsis atlantica TaxID=2614577 RepID=A0A9P7ZUS4_9HYPO|nr:uncharacterized protein F5Z01DRAFT_670894 [Emericellopsis atlantica]KAG9258247.1 hypothetical protein F5Z01DRAFT_670894 [Emericellopsis atlantica]
MLDNGLLIFLQIVGIFFNLMQVGLIWNIRRREAICRKENGILRIRLMEAVQTCERIAQDLQQARPASAECAATTPGSASGSASRPPPAYMV